MSLLNRAGAQALPRVVVATTAPHLMNFADAFRVNGEALASAGRIVAICLQIRAATGNQHQYCEVAHA